MLDGIQSVNQFLDQVFAYGTFWVYGVLFAACFIENIFPPFPGDTFIAVAGGLIAAGRINPIGAFAAIILGGLTSVLLLFLLGSRYGRAYFLKKNFKYFSADDIHRMEGRLRRWGALIIILSRFMIGVRSALVIAAGIAEYNTVKMLIFTAISYILFSSLLIYVAVEVFQNYTDIEQFFRTYNLIILPVLAIVVVAYVIHRFVRLKKTDGKQ